MSEYLKYSKFQIIYKPCQSGKTFEMIADIKAQIRTDPNAINIIFTDNFLVQSVQTKVRVEESEIGKCITISSKQCDSNSAENAVKIMRNEGVNNVVMLANKTRLNGSGDFINLIEGITDSLALAHRDITVWIDEFDKVMKIKARGAEDPYMTSILDLCNSTSQVKNVIGLTATGAHSIFNYMGPFRAKPLVSSNFDGYVGFSDHVYHDVPVKAGIHAIDYAKDVLNKFPQRITPGCVFFVPADVKKDSHNEMEEMLIHDFGFDVVIKLNGTDKCISVKSFRGTTEVSGDMSANLKTKPVDKVLAEHALSEGWATKKVAITGKLCWGRGVTIQSEDLLITDAILPISKNTSKDRDAITQEAGRNNGRVQGVPGRQPIHIYTSQWGEEMLKEQDKIAKELSVWANDMSDGIVHEETLEALNIKLTAVPRKKPSTPVLTRATETIIAEGTDLPLKHTDIKKWLKNVYDVVAISSNTPLKINECGKFKSSLSGKLKVLAYDETVKTIRSWSATSKFAKGQLKSLQDSVEPNACIYTRVACYDGETLKVIIRIVKTV